MGADDGAKQRSVRPGRLSSQATKGEKVEIELSREVPYELDGGERGTVKRLKAKVEPRAITVRVRDGA